MTSRLFSPVCRRFYSTMGAPVLVCGRTMAIGEVVLAGLKPEYDGKQITS